MTSGFMHNGFKITEEAKVKAENATKSSW